MQIRWKGCRQRQDKGKWELGEVLTADIEYVLHHARIELFEVVQDNQKRRLIFELLVPCRQKVDIKGREGGGRPVFH